MTNQQTTYKVEIDTRPVCPHCGLDMFDDWWHDPSFKSSCGIMSGRLKCHGCGKFFHIDKYSDGEVHSSARSKKK